MIVMLALALGVIAVVVYMAVSKRRRSSQSPAADTRDTTPALDHFVRNALEQLLASRVLGVANSTLHERACLRRTLSGEPDPEVVAKIEELVKSVDLEFVRSVNEPDDVEATVRVRYEDGHLGVRSQRLPLANVPATVMSDFETKKTSNVFRTWSFPWQTPAE